jgi:hypothetical protein
VHAALGLAVLVKGPAGALVPLLAFAAHRAWERRPRPFRSVAPPACLLLSFGPAVAWLAASAALGPPGFLREALGEHVFGRFFLGTSHARPPFYYLYQLPADFLPWTLLWPAVAVAGRRILPRRESPRASEWRLLLCWVGAAVVFFSLSAGKRGLYLIPVFPAGALLCADALRELLPERGRAPRWAGGVWLAVLAAVLAAAALLPALLEGHGLAAPSRASAALAVAAALALAARAALRRRPLAAFGGAIALVWAAELVAAFQVLPALDSLKSPRPVAEAAAALALPGEPVGTARLSLAGALLYYGGRSVRGVESEAQLARFLAAGGRVLVLPASRLGLATGRFPVRVHARLRDGSRALLVVTPLARRESESRSRKQARSEPGSAMKSTGEIADRRFFSRPSSRAFAQEHRAPPSLKRVARGRALCKRRHSGSVPPNDGTGDPRHGSAAHGAAHAQGRRAAARGLRRGAGLRGLLHPVGAKAPARHGSCSEGRRLCASASGRRISAGLETKQAT